MSAVLTFLEPGEQIAQIFSMRPRNRKKNLHTRKLSRPGDMTVGVLDAVINSLSQLV